MNSETRASCLPVEARYARFARFGYWPLLLMAAVLLSRVLTTGSVYFADGPAHLKAIESGTYLIQPPGYWLFNRIASLFPNPAAGISMMNWGFSLAGVVVFYYAARALVSEHLAKLGSATYAAVFYAWFSGDVHSTYASQLLFPILVFDLLLLHLREHKPRFLIGASVAFGLGAGLRPSDGAFICLMFVWYLLRYAPRKQAMISFALSVLICLGWLVPTVVGYGSLAGMAQVGHYMTSVTTSVSVLTHGLDRNSIANMARFAVPLIFAVGPILVFTLMSFRDIRRPEGQLLWLWIIPGASFLFFLYMSDAPYLDFLTAAVILLALLGLKKVRRRRQTILLGSCIGWNVLFFLFFHPVLTRSLPCAVIDAYAGRYTRYAIANQWEPTLSQLLREGQLRHEEFVVPRPVPALSLRSSARRREEG